MTIKLILSQLEIDLSNFEFSFVEENNWLKENTISKYTYPGEIELTPEQDAALGNISEQNLASYETLLDAMFYVFGEAHEAVFEIETIIGKTLIFQIRYGLEEFPNFNKRLSELILEKFNLSVSIYSHAQSIITQTWPAVNYNFPQVITDSIDTDNEQWQYFQGIVNKYVGGSFVENSFDAVENEQLNRNIMLPMPYLLYVLQAGFADAGFTLAGEILEDTYYKKATVYCLNSFYTNFNSNSFEVTRFTNSNPMYVERVALLYKYEHDIIFPEPGRYKIAGNVFLRTVATASFQGNISQSLFDYNGNYLAVNSLALNYGVATYKEELKSMDFIIDFTGTEGPLTFIYQGINYSLFNGERNYEALVLDITVTQLAKYDANGELVSTLTEATSIDLSKSVPDMSFGEYVTAVMKKRNYGYTIDGTTISIDKRKTTNLDTTQAVDLTNFEVKSPERNFNRGKTFEFKTFDYESEDYPQQKIYIDNAGYTIQNYTKNDDTEEIVVNAICLPLKVFGIKTAHDFLDDNAKLQLVLYSQLTGGLNLAEDPEGISLLNNYLDDYLEWFTFLLTSQNLVWEFDASYEQLSNLKVRSIIYAYRQYHVIRKLTRTTYLSENRGILLEHEIETESLE